MKRAGVSERAACSLVGLSRGTFRYRRQGLKPDRKELRSVGKRTDRTILDAPPRFPGQGSFMEHNGKAIRKDMLESASKQKGHARSSAPRPVYSRQGSFLPKVNPHYAVVKMVDFSYKLASAFPEDAVLAAPPSQQFKTAPPVDLTREHRTGPRSSHPASFHPHDSPSRIGSASPLSQPMLRCKRRSQLPRNSTPVRPHVLHPLPCR